MLLWQLTTQSDLVALRDVRRKVRDVMLRAGLRADAVADMEVAVGEVLSNACRHAYQGEVGPVSVAFSRHPHRVSVLITDRGSATEAPEIPGELPPEIRDGGRGLYLVARLADDVRIRVNRTGYGLKVRLTKRLRTEEATG